MATYKITIDSTGQSKKEQRKTKLKEVNGSETEQSSDSGKGKSQKTKKAAATGIAVTYAGAIITDMISRQISTIGIRTDNMAKQNEINNAMSIAKDGLSFGAAIAAGTAVGGVWGAAIAAVGATAKKGWDIYKNVEETSWTIAEQAISTQNASERLGILATDRNRGR